MRWLFRSRLLPVLAAGAAVAFIIARSHPAEAWEAVEGTNFLFVVPALLLNLPVVLLTPVRSGLILDRQGHRVRASVLLPAAILGFVAGGITPGASGELLRAEALRRRAGVPFETSVVTIIYERLLAFYLMGLSTATLLVRAAAPEVLQLPVLAAGATLCLLPWLLALALTPVLNSPIRTGNSLPARILRSTLAAAVRVQLLMRDLDLLVRCTLVNAATLFLLALQLWLLAKGVAGGIAFDEAWIALGVSMMAGVASLVPFGLGALDGSMAAVLDAQGMTLEQGGLVALLIRATATLPLIVVAFACYLFLHRTVPRETPPDRPAPTGVAG